MALRLPAVLLSCLLSLGFLLSSCGGPALTEEEKQLMKDSPADLAQQATRRDIVLPLPALPTTLDPAHPGKPYEQAVIAQLYEGLTSYSSHRQVKKQQAESLESGDGGKTWRCKLRDDLSWSDGSKLTAEDYRRSWLDRLVAQPADKAAFPALSDQAPVYLLYLIRGAREYAEGKLPAEKVGIEAKGQELVIHLTEPFARFDQWLSHPFFYPTKKAQGALLTNGAYVVEKRGEDSLELKVNEHYWDKVNLAIRHIRFQVYKQSIEAYESFRNGLVDYIGEPFYPIPRERREEASRRPEVLLFDTNTIGYFAVNKKTDFFATPERRQELYSLLDAPFLSVAILFDGSEVYPPRESPKLEEKKRIAEQLNTELTDKQKEALTETGLVGIAGPQLTEYRLLVASSKEWLGALRIRLLLHRKAEPGAHVDFAYCRDYLPTDKPEDWGLLLRLREGASFPNGFDPASLPKTLGYMPLHRRRAMILINSGLVGVQVLPNGLAHVKDWNFR